MIRGFLLGGVAAILAPASLGGAELSELWAERVRSVVAVEFYVETEVDRRSSLSYGTVVDDLGTIVLPDSAIDSDIAVTQLKDFKVHRAGEAASVPGTYLGQDNVTGWHFVRADAALRGKVTPVTAFGPKPGQAPAIAGVADEVWGIGLRNRDEDFQPYILISRVGMITSLPQKTAIALQEVAGPGLPVFNLRGDFLGLTLSSFAQSYLQFSGSSSGAQPVLLVNVEESSVFPVADEILPYFSRIPKSPDSRPIAWLGAYGLEPLDPEVATFLKLEAQGAAVVSEVIDGGPAEKAGMKDRDIIVALDGRSLPRLKPSGGVVAYVDREVARRLPGDVMPVTVLRGADRVELSLTLAEEPKLIREASRKFYERLGLTVREFVYADALSNRIKRADASGVVASYVKANGLTGSGGLRPDDWIKEIDGVEVKDFAQATAKLAAIEADRTRGEFVILVSRSGETTVLRIKLR